MRNKHYCRLMFDEPRTRSLLHDGRVRITLPDELGECCHDYVELEPGLGVGKLHYRPSVPLIEESHGQHNGRVMVITFGMNGYSRYTGKDSTQLEFEKGHTTISSFQNIAGERCYEADDTISQLRIVAHESLISKYMGEERAAKILGDHPLSHLDFRASTPVTLNHANALLSHLLPCQSNLSRLEMHIHALSLLSEQFNFLMPDHEYASSPFSPSEVERIEKVKRMMIDYLDKPITLDYLASNVGMSKTKLRDGMLYLYNRSPAALLLELRMTKALTLLESGLQVSQVAWQIGYKYANNFTAAFTRYYGKSPRAMFSKRVLD